MLCQQDPEQSDKIYIFYYMDELSFQSKNSQNIYQKKRLYERCTSKVNTLDFEHDKVQRLSGGKEVVWVWFSAVASFPPLVNFNFITLPSERTLGEFEIIESPKKREEKCLIDSSALFWKELLYQPCACIHAGLSTLTLKNLFGEFTRKALNRKNIVPCHKMISI